tara:strand:- start:24324 stop:24728 length:405 start_codon:yes stop_codon:yes gene_type:complete
MVINNVVTVLSLKRQATVHCGMQSYNLLPGVKNGKVELMSHANRKKALLKKHGLKGVNKPKRTPKHPTKSHVVLAQEGHKLKLIRYGQQGVKGAGKNPKTAKEKARRKSFKARHAKNIKKGKMSAAYWANKTKW